MLGMLITDAPMQDEDRCAETNREAFEKVQIRRFASFRGCIVDIKQPIHTYVHTYIHTYIHIYIYIYIYINILRHSCLIASEKSRVTAVRLRDGPHVQNVTRVKFLRSYDERQKNPVSGIVDRLSVVYGASGRERNCFQRRSHRKNRSR